MPTSIGFTGDVMLGRGVDHHQRTRQRAPVEVWGEMFDDMVALDGLIINLECCLSDRGQKWTRTNRPFHFRAHPGWASTALTEAGVDCCALANNHMLDFEEVALADTLDTLDSAGIARTGAGRTEDEALDPAIFDVDNVRIAVVSLTDNTPEFAAGASNPGTAYVSADPDDRTRRLVTEAFSRASDADPDLLVASVHLGPNMVAFPAENLVEFTHFLVDTGADVVHGHSAHVFQGIEQYDEGLILHDTGDFVDDYVVDEGLRNDRGFLYELVVEDGSPTELRLHPMVIRDRQIWLPSGERSWWEKTLRQRSEPFDLPGDIRWDGDHLSISLAALG